MPDVISENIPESSEDFSTPQSPENSTGKRPSSEGKILANQLNEQKSTDPRNGNSKSARALAEPVATQSEQLTPNYIPTDFEEFPDGTLVELVQGPPGLALLVWSEGKASIVDQFEHDGRLLIPPAVDQKLARIYGYPRE